jgi:hypothetical protein
LASLCSCVGPVLDLKINATAGYLDKVVHKAIVSNPALGLDRELFVPAVYDAVLICRPTVHFRDGTVIRNSLNLSQELAEIPFNVGYGLAVTHLICADFESSFRGALECLVAENEDCAETSVIAGFAALYLVAKCYANCLVAEISGCSSGNFRAIGLGSTDGIATHNSQCALNFQPVLVPVGRLALGRILNVLGASIDAFIELSLAQNLAQHHMALKPASVGSCLPHQSYPYSFPANGICTGSKGV